MTSLSTRSAELDLWLLHSQQHQESVLQALAVVMGQQEPARQKFMEAGMMPHIISALGAQCAVVQHPTHRGLVVSKPKFAPCAVPSA